MAAERFNFVNSLLDCILFECVNHYNQCEPELLATCFEFVASMYDDYPEAFDLPCNIYIRKNGLDTPSGLIEHIDTCSEYGSNTIFPMNIAVLREKRSLGRRAEYYDDSDDEYYGGGFAEEFEDVQFVPLQQLLGHEVEQFLFDYAVLVPRVYHNDIAILIQGLRDNVWSHKGSGGPRCWLLNEMAATKKFSRNYNTDKRMRGGLVQCDETVYQNDYSLYQQEVQQQLVEAARREWERERQENDERLRLELLAEEQRQQRIKRQEEAAKKQRNAVITDYMHKLQVSQAATSYRKQEVEDIRQILEQIFQKYLQYDIEVETFGSFASGLCSMNSDADFTVYFRGDYDYDYYPSVDDLAAALYNHGYRDITTIPHARVPIASLILNGIRVDLNIQEPLGVRNSQLISTYSDIDHRFKTLWLSIKQIAKKQGVLSGSTGFLSSYALAMMLIVFLQDMTRPAILPRLQLSRFQSVCTIEGYDCSYDSTTNYAGYGNDNPATAGQLLVSFCHYFGYTFDYASQEVNPRVGKFRNRSFNPPTRTRTDPRLKSWPICIVDPFLTGRNVAGNCTRDNVNKIQDCFRSACDALKNTNINKAFKR